MKHLMEMKEVVVAFAIIICGIIALITGPLWGIAMAGYLLQGYWSAILPVIPLAIIAVSILRRDRKRLRERS